MEDQDIEYLIFSSGVAYAVPDSDLPPMIERKRESGFNLEGLPNIALWKDTPESSYLKDNLSPRSFDSIRSLVRDGQLEAYAQ